MNFLVGAGDANSAVFSGNFREVKPEQGVF